MTERTFVSVDVSNSTLLKHGAADADVQTSFKAYHEFVQNKISKHDGRVISVTGDGIMAEFSAPDQATLSSLSLQKNIKKFNREENNLFQDFRVRIGIDTGEVQDEVITKETANIALDTAGTIQEDGMPGRIFISNATYEKLDALKDRFEYHEYHKALDVEIYSDRRTTGWEDAQVFRNDHYDHGYRLLNKNRFEEAENYFRKALEDAQNAENKRWIASCLHALSYALGRQRRNEEKIELCQRQLELQRELGNERAIQLVNYDLFFGYYWSARDLERSRDFEQALKLYERALESAKKSGNTSIQKRARRNLADLKSYLKEEDHKALNNLETEV